MDKCKSIPACAHLETNGGPKEAFIKHDIITSAVVCDPLMHPFAWISGTRRLERYTIQEGNRCRNASRFAIVKVSQVLDLWMFVGPKALGQRAASTMDVLGLETKLLSILTGHQPEPSVANGR